MASSMCGIQACVAGAVFWLSGCSQQPPDEPAAVSLPDALGPAIEEPIGSGTAASPAATTSPWVPTPQLTQPVTDVSELWRPRSATERAHSADEWLGRIELAFQQPAASQQAAVIICPVLDQSGAIRPDGPAFSSLAAHAATYSPEKRLALVPASVQRIFSAAGCWSPGVRLAHDQIRLCLQACDAKAYVLPGLYPAPGTPGHLDLTVEIYGEDGRELGTRAQHSLSSSQVLLAPGLIAQALLKHLGIELSGRELETVLMPQLQTAADAMLLSGLLGNAPPPDDDALVSFLAQNPGCIPAWEQYLITTGEPSVAGTRLQTVNPPLSSPALAMAAASRLADIGRPEEGLQKLLELAPSHAGDPTYHQALLRCAFRLGDESVIRRLLDAWTSVDPGYRGSLGRGESLLDWAGSGPWTGRRVSCPPVLPACRPRNPNWSGPSRTTLRTGSHIRVCWTSPQDWICLLTSSSSILQRPRECRPQYRDAYVRKLDYLRRQSARYPGRFLAFARECIETKLWKQRVPQAVWEVVYRACHDAQNHATKYSTLRSPDLWDALRLYHDSLETGQVSATEKDTTAKYYALWGAYSGHYVEVFNVFWQIHIAFEDNYAADEIFGLASAHAFVGDLLDAHAGYANFKPLAAAYLALSLGDLDEVDANLRRIQPAPVMDIWNSSIEPLKTAAAQARRLRTECVIEYSPEELKDAFICWNADGPWKHRWVPEDGKLVWKPQRSLNADDTILPFGLGHAAISGVLEWTEGIESVEVVAHTRAPRDRITMAYDPRQGLVRMIRNGKTLATAKLTAGPQRFRLEYGAERDTLQPCDGVVWQAAVVDDVPSGFGLRIVAPCWNAPPASVALSNVKIELHE